MSIPVGTQLLSPGLFDPFIICMLDFSTGKLPSLMEVRAQTLDALLSTATSRRNTCFHYFRPLQCRSPLAFGDCRAMPK